jgi:hypothetical protein
MIQPICRSSNVREDRIHGSLLVLSELMRCSNADWEGINRELEDLSGSGPPLADTETGGQSYFNISTLKKQYKQLAGGKRVAAGTATIPFNWFGSVAVGREPIFESAICKTLLQATVKKNHLSAYFLVTNPELVYI